MSAECGAYGFSIAGLDDPGPLLGPADPRWPALRIERAEEPSGAGEDPGTVRVSDGGAEIWIGDGGRVDVDRAAMTVTFRTRERLEDKLVVHPYLGLPASIASNWLGRQVLHGGGFARDGRAWALLGDKEAGKSSTLGWLAGRGFEILSDDILVIEEGVLFAGPRCVDLRPEAAAILGGEDVGMLGNRVRWRLSSGEAPPSAPLAGVVQLEWGERVLVEPLDAAERLTGLVQGSVIRPGPADAAPFLDLAALPTFRLVRPRDLGALDESGAALLDALG
ncbi:MAG TPA: hypothetical protein VJT75_06510 [Thermoleophilaceae bacterium]|nr:hypothetical protein [Thermoleophilaceae bacterium]